MMLKQENVKQPQTLPFEPELFAEMVAALRNENARAAAEYARIPRAERQAAWWLSRHHVQDNDERYAQKYAKFAGENPLPAGVFCAQSSRSDSWDAFRGFPRLSAHHRLESLRCSC